MFFVLAACGMSCPKLEETTFGWRGTARWKDVSRHGEASHLLIGDSAASESYWGKKKVIYLKNNKKENSSELLCKFTNKRISIWKCKKKTYFASLNIILFILPIYFTTYYIS